MTCLPPGKVDAMALALGEIVVVAVDARASWFYYSILVLSMHLSGSCKQ